MATIDIDPEELARALNVSGAFGEPVTVEEVRQALRVQDTAVVLLAATPDAPLAVAMRTAEGQLVISWIDDRGNELWRVVGRTLRRFFAARMAEIAQHGQAQVQPADVELDS